MRSASAFGFLFLLACSIGAGAALASNDAPVDSSVPALDDAMPAYWKGREEGWFWYKDSADEAKPPEREQRAAKPDTRPEELVAFEAMQKRLEELKRIAIMRPTEETIGAFLAFQQQVTRKSALFADVAQRVVWKTPELDYATSGRPTNNFAMQVFDEELGKRQKKTLQALAPTHGLFFFFRSDCPYCHRFAPVLKRFEQENGLKVFPISLDGGSLPEYPTPSNDNGIAATLQVKSVPALFLAVPGTKQVTPIGYGVLATSDLVERIHLLTRVPAGARW